MGRASRVEKADCSLAHGEAAPPPRSGGLTTGGRPTAPKARPSVERYAFTFGLPSLQDVATRCSERTCISPSVIVPVTLTRSPT